MPNTLPPGVIDADPFEVLDPRFAPSVVPEARAERLWSGAGWAEGPVWSPAGFLLWSDIPGNRMMRWDLSGAITTFRQPSHGANGNTRDRQGRLITCEHFSRRVTRTEPDGRVTVLAEQFQGKRFNSPNDVVEHSDGSIWFTDPSYGKGDPNYDGVPELTGCHVYRLDPTTGATRQMTDDMVMPNGLAFSADESLLYVVDTGSTEGPHGPNHIRRFSVGDRLGGGEVFATSAAKAFDGIRFDRAGRLWASSEVGADVYDPDGTMIGRVHVPEPAANLCFGGADGNTLFLTATTSLYRVQVRQ